MRCCLLLCLGVRRYGKDFGAIAEILGSKTNSQVKNLFISCHDRFNLDSALKDFEKSNKNNVVKQLKPLPAGTQLLVS